ncbi:MAG: FAD-dependent oxidoreductase [Pseudomonadales bacterium]|jgi:D-arginine dehydrogenase|nr:FAD-dependent oxidoreductase [Pseudomonadales bacterium]
MSGDGEHWDVIVVGAGIAGLSLAGELAASARVLVLEREAQSAYHASGRSAAVSVEPFSTDPVYALTRATTPFLERPPPDFSEHSLVSPRGFLVLARPGEEAGIDRFLGAWSARCPAIRELGEAEARQRVPVLRPGAAVRFALDPAAVALDTHGMLQGWTRRLRAGGGCLVTGAEVTSVLRRDGRFEVRWQQGAARAPVLVNAAGAWASAFAALAGATAIRLVPHRRSAAIIAPPAGHDVSGWPMVVPVAEDFYFKPEGGRLMLSPADQTPSEPMDAWPEDLDLAAAVERAEAVAELGVRRFESTWAGLRTFAPDRQLVLGWDPILPGFYWCAGQGGAGFQSSAGAARWCAAELGVGAAPAGLEDDGFDAARVRPDRFA